MRIFVANTYVPLTPDPLDTLAAHLSTALNARGHTAERVRIPFAPELAEMLEQMLALRLTEVSDVGDLMIAVGAPAHLLRHQRKVLWLSRCDETCGTWVDADWELPLDQQGRLLREAGIAADRLAFGEARRFFAVSTEVCQSALRLSGVAPEPLHPPAADAVSGEAWTAVVERLVQ
jgi:hypothetical protein